MPSHSPENSSDTAAGASPPAGTRASRRPWKLLIASIVALALVFVLAPRKSSFRPLPEPNGYDALVRAAAKTVRSDKSLKELTADELAAFVATNRTFLLELRRGLQLTSAVPVRMDEKWIASETTNLTSLKRAAWAMEFEIHYRQAQGDITGALDESHDLLRFGRAIGRQGLLIDFLVGSACEVMAIRRMTNLLHDLTAAQCKQLARQLETYESGRETFEEIMAREREWQQRTFSLFTRLRETFEERILRRKEPWSVFMPDTKKEFQTRTVLVRRTLLESAARAFELENHRRPQNSSELVPSYLRELPCDPFSGAALELP